MSSNSIGPMLPIATHGRSSTSGTTSSATASKYAGDQGLQPEQALEALHEINHEVPYDADIGSLFYPYTRDGISPRFTVDEASGLGLADFLECSLLRDPDRATHGPTLWRVSPDGSATFIDAYREDDADGCKHLGMQPCTWFSPNIMVRLLAGFVRHARAMAERFDSAIGVSFRCEWCGLSGRRVD